MARYADVVAMNPVCVRIVVVAAEYAGPALLVIVLDTRIALVKPIPRITKQFVEL